MSRGWRVAAIAGAIAVLAVTGTQSTPQLLSRPEPPSPSPTSTQSARSHVPPSTPAPPDWAQSVRAENARRGTASWQIPSPRGSRPGLDVYLDRVSVLPGEDVGVYVSAAGRVSVRVLRIGYYGGLGAREVFRTAWTARLQPAARELRAPIADAGGVRDSLADYAPWQMTGLLSTNSWPEGEYLIRVDSATASRYAPLTVRSADLAGRLVVVDAPMTWEAYNIWGGRGLYGDQAGAFGRRSLAVSFDRPYRDGYGAGRYFSHDRDVVVLAERLGLPLAWVTDYDLAVNPRLLHGATGVVFGGHAEYWTGPMWDAVARAVRDGVNLAVMGANTAYWRVRLARASPGMASDPARLDGRPRLVFGAKDAGLDPMARRDPAGATARFKDPPGARREDALTGVRYDCFPAAADWVVADASWWGYRGTGLHVGARLPGLVAPESDRAYPQPVPGMTRHVVAYTQFSCRGNRTAQTALYSTDSAGAGVFVAGTMRFAEWAGSVVSTTMSRIVSRIAANVLTEFAMPAAGRRLPTTDNLRRFWLPPRTTSGAA